MLPSLPPLRSPHRPALRWATLLPVLLLSACATLRPPPNPTPLLRDALFEPSQDDTDPARVLAMSDAMRAYADTELRARIGRRDARRVLIEALHERGQLEIAYDATRTGNAAETFEARRGNCLALVLMTGAFSRHLGLEVTYRNVVMEPQYSRAAGLTLETGHVNLLMAQSGHRPLWGANDLIIDFLPTPETRGRRVEALEEQAVLAMYMNNRAAERLAEGRVDDAYAWVRAALRQDPRHGAAANTLAVIYMRRGALKEAEDALRFVLAREPENTAALSNLVSMLRSQGRGAEAEHHATLLRRLQPVMPFELFEKGRQALAAGDALGAREFFAKELRLQPFQHEVHFWAAQAALQLGDRGQADEHLRMAADYSPTLAGQKLYTAKLERLRAARLQ